MQHLHIIAYAKEMYDLPCDVDTELLKLRQIRTAFDLTFLLVENTACRGCKRYTDDANYVGTEGHKALVSLQGPFLSYMQI